MILLERGKFTLKLFRLERQEVHKDTAEVAHIARGSSRKRAQRKREGGKKEATQLITGKATGKCG